jgi:hypothetical protein
MSDKTSWPAWYYGPKGASQVFENEKDVPSGWHDHPSKVKDVAETVAPKPAAAKAAGGAKAAPQAGTAVDGKQDVQGDAADLDADGWPWSPELHSATKTKTTAGLWRMKVGVSRPAPKPKLDL